MASCIQKLLNPFALDIFTEQQPIVPTAGQGHRWVFTKEGSANDATDKSLVSKIYKWPIQLNHKKIQSKNEKTYRDSSSAKTHRMANRCTERGSPPLVIRETQIKTTMKHDLTPARMAIMKKPTGSICWRGCEEKGTLLHCWWECKLA